MGSAVETLCGQAFGAQKYGMLGEKCKETWDGFAVQAFSGLWGFFKLSAASAVMLCLETCMTISGWVFMISVGFNAAVSLTLLLNGVQPVLSGVAVGCGWQAFVAYVNVGCYYVVGIPSGIWSGMIGGIVLQPNFAMGYVPDGLE
ncbi:Protein TRANSPARENT TESTA [Salix suchowensis]|nr:Protein TRANSPARENT TESTA [Salix suchowensis]